MTMTRRIMLLVAAVLLAALLGSLWIHSLAARDALQTQLELRNQDAATALALSLSQQDGDLAAMQTVAAAQFELGQYQRLVFTQIDGKRVFERKDALNPPAAPRWFIQALPVQAPPGRATVMQGWRELGVLQLESQAGWVHETLWAACSRTAALMLVLAGLAMGLSVALLRGWQRPLASTVAQAQAIESGRFVIAEVPAMPELRHLTRSMNAMVRRLRELFDSQAEQVASLQRQAQTDGVTGLPLRRQFVGRLADRLANPDAPGSGLLLVRLLRLETVNERLGFAATDRLLAATADGLSAYVERVHGAVAGRLNGSDFGLLLPVTGVAAETAQSLFAALNASPLATAGAVSFAVGGVDGLLGQSASAALAAADLALARGEASRSAVVDAAGVAATDLVGARAWRLQITAALDEGRMRLSEFPVVDRAGHLIHLECPLRVQFLGADGVVPEGAGDDGYRPAREWLALAMRSRLMPRVDLAALDLALKAINADGLSRCVHVAQDSVLTPGFVSDVLSRLSLAQSAARQLSIEWMEAANNANPTVLREVANAWRAVGVRVGVEHAGASAQALAQWHSTRVDFIKVDARHVHGAASDEAVRGYAASLVSLVHGLGLKAIAEGISDPDDLAAVWDLGFDGATGPAVTSIYIQS